MKKIAAFVLLCVLVLLPVARADAPAILFVGNSFTYARPPALQYNIGSVVDMNYPNFLANPAGSDPALPQPWGGVAGIFKALADQAGIEWQVYHSLRGGATLRGHYLNTNPANWDMRANIAARKWDIVVLQGNSTEALARAGGDPAQFAAYVNKLEKWIHSGAAEEYRESTLFPGGSNALRTIPANPNASAETAVFLYQTWARPDLTYLPDAPYFGEPLETMTRDLTQAYRDVALANGRIAAVAPVGEAFLRAVQTSVAVRDPYNPTRRGVDLWWHEDQFHPSRYGSYLSALVLFGTVTRICPTSFGANEQAASDLGIKRVDAMRLQQVAADQLAASGFTLRTIPCLHASPNGSHAPGRLVCRGRD